MGKMKQIAIAIEEAQMQGLLPTPPSVVYVLTHNGQPVGVYVDKLLVEYDVWLCNSHDDECGYSATELPLFTETMEGIEACRG